MRSNIYNYILLEKQTKQHTATPEKIKCFSLNGFNNILKNKYLTYIIFIILFKGTDIENIASGSSGTNININ